MKKELLEDATKFFNSLPLAMQERVIFPLRKTPVELATSSDEEENAEKFFKNQSATSKIDKEIHARNEAKKNDQSSAQDKFILDL
jgi:hypothetical protein